MLEMLRTSHNPFSSLPYISVFYQTFVSSLIIFDYFPIFIRAISFLQRFPWSIFVNSWRIWFL